jgi:hypothetical protein
MSYGLMPSIYLIARGGKMKKLGFNLFLLAMLMLCFSTAQAWAAKPLKGNWVFTLQTPMGALPVPVSFKAKGKGTLSSPTGALPIAYRESSDNFSVSLEGPGLAPDGSNLSLVIRGSKTDSAVTAKAILITETADPANPTGFAVVVLDVAGARQ